MTLRSIPDKDDILIVGEDWVVDYVLRELRSKKDEQSDDERVRTVWHVELKHNSASCLLDACISPPVHLFENGARCEGPSRRIEPSAQRPDGGSFHRKTLERASLAIWPSFGKIFVQRDVRLDRDARLSLVDAAARSSSNESFVWLWESLANQHDLEEWLNPGSVLPLGWLFAHLFRHELSVPESTEISVVTFTERGYYNQKLRKQLDANERIKILPCKEREQKEGEESFFDVDKTIAERAAQAVVRIMRALLCRKISASMGFCPSSGPFQGTVTWPTSVVFVDDNPKNLTGFSAAFGSSAFTKPQQNGPGHFIAIRTGNEQGDASPRPLLANTSQWDEHIRNTLRQAGGNVADHLFVVCDYDLDCSKSTKSSTDPDSFLTGAKLAALIRNHWLLEPPNSDSEVDRLVSAMVFSGGRSPIIALESISDGCDLAIAKAFDGSQHPPADVGGMSALMFWIWVISSHHALISGRIESIGTAPEAVIKELEFVSRCVIRRGIALPTSLQPHLNKLRFEGYRSLQEGDPWSEPKS